jgi:uncharacterized integral membrane protein
MTRRFLLLLIIGLALVSAVSATTITGGGGDTAKGPLNLLVPLGIEQTGIPAATAIWWYNIISMGTILFVAAAASERTTRFFNILVPVLAGLFIWMGWMQPNSPLQTSGIIIGVILLAVMSYMKGSLREGWGIGGPGGTLMNLAAYLILLQCIIGVVNGMGIFTQPAAPTPAEWQQSTLSTSVTEMTNSGGLMQDLISYGSLFVTMAIGAIKMIMLIIQSILFFSTVVMQLVPGITASPLGMGIVLAFQIGEWILLGVLAYQAYYLKSPWSVEL